MGRARVGPLTDGVDEFAAGAQEPARVADEPTTVGHGGFFWRMENAEKVIRLRERKLGMTQRGHGRERGTLCRRKRARGFVSREERVQVIEVDGHCLGMGGIIDEHEPLDDVALDGVSDIVDGVGQVGESEVDDGSGARGWSRVAPEKIRRV